MARSIGYVLLMVTSILVVCCKESEPAEYEPWPIEGSFIYYSEKLPKGFVPADTRPKYVETEEEYQEILKNWGIDTMPFEYDPNDSSLITVVSLLDYPIEDVEIKVWYGKERVSFWRKYHYQNSEREEEYYELIMVKLPKLPAQLPIFFIVQ